MGNSQESCNMYGLQVLCGKGVVSVCSSQSDGAYLTGWQEIRRVDCYKKNVMLESCSKECIKKLLFISIAWKSEVGCKDQKSKDSRVAARKKVYVLGYVVFCFCSWMFKVLFSSWILCILVVFPKFVLGMQVKFL